MANKKLVDMTEDTSPTYDDIAYVVNNPGGTPTDRKSTLGNIFTKAHGLSGDGYLLKLSGTSVVTTNSLSGVTIGGFTASKVLQSDASGNAIAGAFNFGTMTDTKWCRYTTAGGLACDQDQPTGGAKGYLWIPAGTMVPDTCSGLLQKDSDPNIFDYLAFDGATDEYATFHLSLEDWDLSTIKAKFVWAISASATAAQTVIWGLNCYAVSDGDTIDVAFASGEQTASDAYASSDETGPIQKTTSATSAITVQGTPAAGDVVYCRVSRDADTDTVTIDAWLIGVKIEYGKTTPSAW